MSTAMGSVEIGDEYLYAQVTGDVVVALEMLVRDILVSDGAFTLALVSKDHVVSTVISRGVQVRFSYPADSYEAQRTQKLLKEMTAAVREHGELRIGVPS